ncbi:MAG: LLM class flavin-dependent oxidoreductase [Chloroflexi bacterium]|nr:LLM class flavin-dependent oxidoreductase [Chloroflexota bacterium]
MPLKFGVIYEVRNPRSMLVPYGKLYAGALEHFKAMEELGYDYLVFTEHHFDPDGHMPSPVIWCAAAAAVTKRVTVGTSLVLLPFQHPVKLAEDLATIDIISGGRLLFQGGEGFRTKEFAGMGVPMKERGGRSEEAMDIIRKCFTEESFDYDGRYFKLKNVQVVPKPLQKPHPPMFMAGSTPGTPMERTIQMGFHCATAVSGHGYTDLDAWTRWHGVWADTARRLGKNPKALMVTAIVPLHPAEDPERAWHKHKFGILSGENAYRREGGRQPVLATPEEMPGWQTYFQTPDDCVKYLRRVYGEATPDYLHFRFGFWPAMPPEESLEYHRLMTQKVLPRLRDLKPWRER